MVSFTCNICQDVVKKPKVVGHAASCGSHSFTCVDCMQVFDLNTIKPHTTCVSEVEKYQGKWLQKNKTTYSSSSKRNLDSSDDEGTSGKPKKDGLQRPPRATMDDLDTDSDDDDWMTTSKKAKTSTAAPTHAASGKKRPRPGAASSSDDDDDGTEKPPAKAHKVISSRSPALSARKESPKKAAKAPTPRGGPETVTAPSHPRHPPLTLPRSTAATECEMPTFVLDTTESLAAIVKDVLAHEGGGARSMKKKDLAKALVERYLVRIAKKGMMPAVDAAVHRGCLTEDANGSVRLA